MGSSRWWWSNSEKADTQFSEQRVRFLEERSKAKEVENYLYISVPMVIRMKLFFAQSFLTISSVSTEQSQQCDEYSIRAIRPIFRASTLTDDTRILDWDSCTKKSIAEAQRTSGKIFTTRSFGQKKLYWCRIPDNSSSRTILHDKTYWRVLKRYRARDMSCVYFTTRWQIHWPERLDSRERQDWTRIGSYNLLSWLQGEYGVEIRIESVNNDNSHSRVSISHDLNKLVTDLIDKEYDDNEQETSTTKTEVFAFASRSMANAKPKRPSTNCYSSRTILFLKEHGLILKQKLNSIKLTQWQED